MNQGLSNREAQSRLNQFGPNEIPDVADKSLFATVWEILTEPMLLLLLVAALVYLVIGDLAEGLLLLGFAVLSVVLVIYQQRRSDNALKSLRVLGAPGARVVREGRETRIPARELVPGDLAIIGEGERIPADAMLVQVEGLLVDESVLTGESVPVRKTVFKDQNENIVAPKPGGDDQPFVYSGTLIVRGRALAEITQTGTKTHVGKIGVSLATIETEKTRLQMSTAYIVRIFGLLALIVSASLVVFYGMAYGDWLQGFLSGIAIAMSMLPEELPIALTLFFAIGAWRLAQIKVLARRPAVVEMLGAATVLCVDKTGTITQNRMRIFMLDIMDQRLSLEGGERTVAEDFRVLVDATYLATPQSSIDPMDCAVCDLASDVVDQQGQLHPDWTLARTFELAPELLAMTQVWQDKNGDFTAAAKGAPEAIAQLCHLDSASRENLLNRAREMARQGLRVLGVASCQLGAGELPDNQHGFGFKFLGLVGFHDPVLESVPVAVKEAIRAGVSVKMITGDFPETASAIAATAGIDQSGGILTGEEMARMSDADLRSSAANINVYARMMPDQKLRLVQALKAGGEVVAMTGDGVNDAPALKAAHIGIAMGVRGTDVAREASDIILLDENFGRIVSAVRMGRRIFDNLRKVVIYISSVHVAIAGLALIPLIVGMPPLLFPAHVVLIEMIIDPMCSISFETTPDEPGLMETPPRPLSEPLAGINQIGFGFLQGAWLLVVCMAIYWLSIEEGATTNEARALVFLSLTAGNLALVRVSDTSTLAIVQLFSRGHRTFWIITAVASSIVGVCVLHPALRGLFAFETPDFTYIALAIATTLVLVFAFDFLKLLPPVRRTLGHEVLAKTNS